MGYHRPNATLAALPWRGSAAGMAVGGGGDEGRTGDQGFEYAIGLWGDLPYSDVPAFSGVPSMIADMNRQRLAFVAHDGDPSSREVSAHQPQIVPANRTAVPAP